MEYLANILEHMTGDPVAFQITFTLTIACAIFALAIGVLYIASSFSSPLRKRLQVTTGQPAGRAGNRAGAGRAVGICNQSEQGDGALGALCIAQKGLGTIQGQ